MTGGAGPAIVEVGCASDGRRATVGGAAPRPTAAVVAVAALTLLLTGCPRHPPPVEVSYPDDPRVLHGAWEAQVTGLLDGARDLVYAPAAGRLVAWFPTGPRAFDLDDDGWRETTVTWSAPVDPDAYDPSIESFVAVELARADPRIRVVPIDGGPASVAAVTLPVGHTLVSAARGSGRAFALTRDGGGGHHLTWWDAASGAAGGTHRVGAAPDGMRASSNGRVLALWDVRAGRVELVDTTAPHVLRTLRLGWCRGAGVSEASADGRWFLLADCVGNLRIADLAAPSLTSGAIGVAQEGRVVFALDGAEIVWVDRGGVIHALDAASRERSELARLEGDDPLDALEPWYRRVVVHHATNVLAVVTGRGTVRTAGLPGATAPRPAIELPVLALSGATLDLAADPIAEDGAHEYEFGGTFTASGPGAAGESWPLTGRAYAYGLHRYLPATAAVAPAVAPPPTLSIAATVFDPVRETDAFELHAFTTDRRAAELHGTLWDLATDTTYRVRVARAGENVP